MVLYNAEGDALYLGDYDGQVVDIADPLDLGQVKVTVPGLVEAPGAWAMPIGGAHSTGGKGVGSYDVPPKGASVKVSFAGGNIDRPEYKGGFHGKGEQLSVTPSDRAQADKLKAFESARFLIVLNGIGGEEELLVKDKTTGDQVSMKPDRTLVQASQEITADSPTVNVGGKIGAEAAIKGETYRTAEATLDTAWATLLAAVATYATAIAPVADPLFATTPPTSPTGVLLAALTDMIAAVSAFEGGAVSYLAQRARVL